MKFEMIVARIRSDRASNDQEPDFEPKHVPDFDPNNGNEKARMLSLFEAPGPGAVQSGIVSFDNRDPTARNFRDQLGEAGIDRRDIAMWNIVPWYISAPTGNRIRAANTEDIEAGRPYLDLVLAAMPNLKCIVLVGAAARKAHVYLSYRTAKRIVSCHHTSAKALNANPGIGEENIEVLLYLKDSLEISFDEIQSRKK